MSLQELQIQESKGVFHLLEDRGLVFSSVFKEDVERYKTVYEKIMQERRVILVEFDFYQIDPIFPPRSEAQVFRVLNGKGEILKEAASFFEAKEEIANICGIPFDDVCDLFHGGTRDIVYVSGKAYPNVAGHELKY